MGSLLTRQAERPPYNRRGKYQEAGLSLAVGKRS